MNHVIDTLTEYRDTYKDLIDNPDVVTLPVYKEKYNQYSEALKNMESSRIIHSQPINGDYYWIKQYKNSKWEVAMCGEDPDHGLLFYMTDGNVEHYQQVSDWIKTPIVNPKS